MKVSVERRELNEVLAPLSRVAGNKSVLPILECVCLTAETDRLILFTYNLEVSMKREVPARVYEPGSVAVSAKLLVEIIRRSTGDFTELSTDDHLQCRVESGQSVYELPGQDTKEFPELPPVGETKEKITLAADVFREMVNRTVFAVAGDDTQKPVLKGELFEITPSGLTVVAVDGFRMAIRHAVVDAGFKASVVIPGKLLSEMIRLLKEDTEQVEILFSERFILMRAESYEVTARLLEGEFLNYKNSVPTAFATSAVVRPDEIAETVDRVSLVISEQVKTPVRLVVQKDRMIFSGATAMGKATDSYDVVSEGEELEIGFNSRFLTDALKATGEEEVRLRFNGSFSPIVLTPVSGDAYCYLVMPMRLPGVGNPQ